MKFLTLIFTIIFMNEKKYKYWFFYIKPEFIDDVVLPQLGDTLYAYTDNKDYAEKFMNTRDMNKFVLKKSKISKGLVNYYADNIHSGYLSEESLPTKPDGRIVNIVMTSMERSNLKNTINSVMLYKLWRKAIINPESFINKYKNALKYMGFDIGYDYMSGDSNGTELLPNLCSFPINGDYLSAFIHLNSKILKIVS